MTKSELSHKVPFCYFLSISIFELNCGCIIVIFLCQSADKSLGTNYTLLMDIIVRFISTNSKKKDSVLTRLINIKLALPKLEFQGNIQKDSLFRKSDRWALQFVKFLHEMTIARVGRCLFYYNKKTKKNSERNRKCEEKHFFELFFFSAPETRLSGHFLRLNYGTRGGWKLFILFPVSDYS